MTGRLLAALLAVYGLSCSTALAGNRAYVSRTGTFNTFCSITAPCASFEVAISVAGAGGEVICLDSGFFGSITTTFSMHIKCDGQIGQTGANVITVNIAAGDVVVLEGIDVNHREVPIGGPALRFTGAGSLHLRNSTITSSGVEGLVFTPNGPASLLISNTKIENNTGVGLTIRPTAGTTLVDIDGLQSVRNQGGVFAVARTGTQIRLEMRNSMISRNSEYGFVGASTGGRLVALIDDSAVSNNATIGVYSSGAQSSVLVSRSSIVGNNVGWAFASGGALLSYRNNNLSNISQSGGASGFIGQQ